MGIDIAVKRPAVFLDRDGVLVRAVLREGRPYPPKSWAQTELMSDALDATHLLKKWGYLLIVITNQPDVARGTADRQEIESIHRELCRRLPLDEILVCYHDDCDTCSCRKPKPGLLFLAADKWQIDLPASFLIGDRWRDTDAGDAAGCRTIFLDYEYQERRPTKYDYRVKTLWEAVQLIGRIDGKEMHEID